MFYQEAGPQDAPVLLLPHGYPYSSFEFRNFMPPLADEYRLVAPDFPGFGYSATPAGFDYSFGGYADFLERFARALDPGRYALYTTTARRSACGWPSECPSGSRRSSSRTATSTRTCWGRSTTG